MQLCHSRPPKWSFGLAVILTLGACSDSTAPTDPPPSEGSVAFEVSYGADEFVLDRVSHPTPDGHFVEVDLIGKNVTLDDTGEGVSVDVAIRNSAERRGLQVTLFPRVLVTLQNFRPQEVLVTNADFVMGDSLPSADGIPLPPVWVFDYSDQLGEDGVLTPGETSAFRTWEFRDVGQGPFSFEAGVEFSLEPDRPHISGYVFSDLDRDGRLDPDEIGNGFGAVEMQRPDGSHEIAGTAEDGSWSIAAKEPGLYTLTYIPPPTLGFAPICLTTPNPLQVLLTPGPDGRAHSYEEAHFGIDPEPCFLPAVPPVEVVAERPDPDVVPMDPYQFISMGLRSDRYLRVRIGFSGCSAEHPVRLFAGASFAESNPPQTWAVIAHDSLGEFCDAYFEQDLTFDLAPLRAAHMAQYGRPGPFDLVLHDFGGTTHTIRIP